MKTFWTSEGEGATVNQLRAFIQEARGAFVLPLIPDYLTAQRHLASIESQSWRYGDKPTNLAIGDGEIEAYDIIRIEYCE